LITAKTWKNGFANGLKTSFLLLKVIIPVFALIKVLEHTPVIVWIAQCCDPLIRFVLAALAAFAVSLVLPSSPDAVKTY
jgi:hypothetical protein